MSRCNSSFADVQLSLEKNSRFSLIRGFFSEIQYRHGCSRMDADQEKQNILYTLCMILQNSKFQNHPIELESYMHRVLNLNEIKKLIAQFACKLQDECNEPNQGMIRH